MVTDGGVGLHPVVVYQFLVVREHQDQNVATTGRILNNQEELAHHIFEYDQASALSRLMPIESRHIKFMYINDVL